MKTEPTRTHYSDCYYQDEAYCQVEDHQGTQARRSRSDRGKAQREVATFALRHSELALKHSDRALTGNRVNQAAKR
jgi:hypothetical protein